MFNMEKLYRHLKSFLMTRIAHNLEGRNMPASLNDVEIGGKSMVTSKWIYEYAIDGNIEKYKARILLGRGK